MKAGATCSWFTGQGKVAVPKGTIDENRQYVVHITSREVWRESSETGTGRGGANSISALFGGPIGEGEARDAMP